jgi:hypothetical protein
MGADIQQHFKVALRGGNQAVGSHMPFLKAVDADPMTCASWTSVSDLTKVQWHSHNPSSFSPSNPVSG